MDFQLLTSSFTPTIFTWSFYSDFLKIADKAFEIKLQLNILNSLIGEKDSEKKFLEIIREYPKVRWILPILIAVRKDKFKTSPVLLDESSLSYSYMDNLFKVREPLNKEWEMSLLKFFNETWLRNVFENKNINNLNDFVFGVETWLDTNARKNRSGKKMESIVEIFVRDFCSKKSFNYKTQATVKWIKENWGVKIASDISERKFDFAIFTWKKVYLIETNFYWGGGSKLKSVAWEFSGLYSFLEKQDVQLLWVTDGLGWKTALRPLEDAYNATNGNIYSLAMLREGVLGNLIK